MVSKKGLTGIMVLVALLVFSSFAVMNAAGDVNYTLVKSDPASDSEGSAGDTTVLEDADIIEIITDKKKDDIIVLKMKVSGTVYTTAKGVVAEYSFHIDINGDTEEDWEVTTFNSFTSENNTELEDDNNEHEQVLSQSGNGTNTLTVEFPLSHITDHDTVESWNVYCESSVTIQMKYASDVAPNAEFEDGGDGGDGSNGDGDSETPTDTSIKVTIDTAIYSVKEEGDDYLLEEKITGTTDGVHHCKFATLLKSDIVDDDYFEGEYDADNTMSGDVTFEFHHFKDTSDSNDWTTWELHIRYKIAKNFTGKMSGGTLTVITDEKQIPDLVAYVRAYKDEAETLWNQASKDIIFTIPGATGDGAGDGSDGDSDGDGDGEDKKEEDKGFLPGFELVAILGALATILLLYRKRK